MDTMESLCAVLDMEDELEVSDRMRLPKDNDRRDESSIFITEGLSASGSITKIRDVETQAVFSLRGKPLNTYGMDPKKVITNVEFAMLQSALNIEDGIDGLRFQFGRGA